MNKISAFIMIIITFICLLLSILPLVFISTYVFTGCSKESFMVIIQQIPARIFWLVGLPLFVMCYGIAFYLLWKFFKLGISHPEAFKFKVKKVYRLEDDDIISNLTELISGGKMIK